MTTESIYDRYEATDSFFGLTGATLGTWKVDYFVDNFAELLPGDRRASVLDVGCGQGEILAGLRLLGYQNCAGIDISQPQLDIARARFGVGENVHQADAVAWLRQRPSSFDCILAVDILEHLPLDELVEMGEAINGALRPQGRCVVQVPNSISPMNPILHGDITHCRAFTVQSLGQFFLLAGLEPVAFRETPPRPRSVAGRARRLAWKAAIRPALRLLMLAIHGPTSEKVFTANMIGVAEKK